jgi:ATP-binding cassette, subfamily F, member 3
MISFQNVKLYFGERRLFDDISFQVNPKDRIGLVGKNGAGKTTILKSIVGLATIDSGNIVIPRDASLGYLPQELLCKDKRSVLEEAMTAFSDLHRLEHEIEHLNKQLTERTDYESGEYMELAELVAEKSERLHLLDLGTAEASAVKTLLGLGFLEKDFQRPTSEFSGGWRMRIELAKILLQAPDVFLLDEPTNHLDIESIQWLENFLSQYHGAVLLISHDRAFLDNVTTRTLEISLGKIYDYKVSYSKYVGLRKERREQQMAAFRNQQKQIEDTRDFIERFRYKATKAVQVQSRIKQLDRMDIIEIEEEDISSLHIKFPPAPRSGTLVVEMKNLTKKYGNHVVLQEIDLVVERGEKIAFVGRNGEGKTTLSRIIVGELDYSGVYKPGHNVRIGYYAQNQDELIDPERTVLQTIDRVAVGEVRTKIRDILGAFLFRGEDVDKKVKVLSGGEKSRLAMARLLLEPYNLLVLDEPTNHLDMRSKDILKQALKKFDGTLILVSHDREFLDGLTDKIFDFRDNKIKEFRGGIYEFLKKRKMDSLQELNLKSSVAIVSAAKTEKPEQKQVYQERRELDKEIRKAGNQLDKIEKEITLVELTISEMDMELAEGKVMDHDFYTEYNTMKEKLHHLLQEWEKLQIAFEALKEKRNSVI